MKAMDFVVNKIERTAFGSKFLSDEQFRIISKAVFSLVFNLLFAFYNGILGIISGSLLFAASSVYYLLLSSMRFSAVMSERKSSVLQERQTVKLVGSLLIVLSIVFHVIIIFSLSQNAATVYGEITMIAIATFTFTKITAAIITAAKKHKNHTDIVKLINNIRYSEVAVSLLTMQQSMIVSFGDMPPKNAVILNACTGGAVCFFILALGIITVKNSNKNN